MDVVRLRDGMLEVNYAAPVGREDWRRIGYDEEGAAIAGALNVGASAGVAIEEATGRLVLDIGGQQISCTAAIGVELITKLNALIPAAARIDTDAIIDAEQKRLESSREARREARQQREREAAAAEEATVEGSPLS